ncbi:MAG: flagellar FlbD family protein [Deltaproteobacteria bacterium]|nr:flagellar FlbD family protein [Deltaproteobacteria bacterium]
MIKLTRLNNQTVVVNPDHIYAVDAAPDTTLRLIGGETIIVRESLDELIERAVDYRRRIRGMAFDDGGRDAATVATLTPERQTRDSRSPSDPDSRRPPGRPSGRPMGGA